MFIFAYDSRHEPVDISGRTLQDALAGVDGTVTAEHGKGVLDIVTKVRTGIRHNWDADTHQRVRVAYFRVTDHGSVREIYITPTGQQCKWANNLSKLLLSRDNGDNVYFAMVNSKGELTHAQIGTSPYGVRIDEIRCDGRSFKVSPDHDPFRELVRVAVNEAVLGSPVMYATVQTKDGHTEPMEVEFRKTPGVFDVFDVRMPRLRQPAIRVAVNQWYTRFFVIYSAEDTLIGQHERPSGWQALASIGQQADVEYDDCLYCGAPLHSLPSLVGFDREWFHDAPGRGMEAEADWCSVLRDGRREHAHIPSRVWDEADQEDMYREGEAAGQ